jgi:hypothetical protein
MLMGIFQILDPGFITDWWYALLPLSIPAIFLMITCTWMYVEKYNEIYLKNNTENDECDCLKDVEEIVPKKQKKK